MATHHPEDFNRGSGCVKIARAKKTHLFGLAAGGSQQERVQDVLPSQEEAVAVLVQEDGGERQLAVMAAEDGRAVGGQQVCGDTGERRV